LKEKQEKFDFTSIGKRVLTIESAAIARLKDQLDNNFDIACQLCLDCSGKIIVMGMGKSGHIADKLAATLASTGTPSFFVHPGEASHGDLGMISRSDVVIALSNSGKTEEIVSLLPILNNMGIKIIAMTGDKNSKIELLIADEPTTSLDTKTSFEIMQEIIHLCNEFDTTLILISHDINLAAKWCKKVAIIEKGSIVEKGNILDIFQSPKSDIGKKLVNASKIVLEPNTKNNARDQVVLEVNNLRHWYKLNSSIFINKWNKALNNQFQEFFATYIFLVILLREFLAP